MSDVDYDAVSYVISSRYRTTVLLELDGGPATPSAIAERTDDGIAHVSRALGELRDHEIVELLVDEERKKGRIYGLCESAEELVDPVAGMTEVEP